MGYKCFEDSDGNGSPKRIIGAVLVSLGIALGIVLFFLACFKIIEDAETALYIVVTFLSTGCTLLGIGTFEKIGRYKPVKSNNIQGGA